MGNRFSKLRRLSCILSLTLLVNNPLWADDTEIFFSRVSSEEAQSNILFLLDASYSMEFYDCANGGRKWVPCDDGSENGNLTRRERMNAAMVKIINNTENANIGLMRFSHTLAGSKVIYPVRNIEQTLCDGVPCDESNFEFTGTKTTVRQELIDVIQGMVMQWRTPTIGGLLEAVNYYKGEPVHYGKTRWTESEANGSYEFGEHSRVSHADSYTGGTLNRSGECTDADLSHEDCADENITGSPVYISPIKNECQANHLVMVSDGEANKDSDSVTLAKTLVGNNCPSYSNFGECAVEIADYLFATDLRTDIDGTQNVTTHTIGLNLNSTWLKDIATATRVVDGATVPGYYEAESTDELVDVIEEIIAGAGASNTTFVAPGATVDRFSRISHRNDLYLSLFKPSESTVWPGNLKRYVLRGNPPELYDNNDPQAAVVDSDTGSFHTSSKSFWSAESDGHSIAAGGAASNLDHVDRNTVTYTGTEAALLHDDNALDVDNELITYNAGSEITNLAPTGTTSQSSISHNGAPSRAIDGNTSGVWGHASVTHTKNEVQPWWELSLPTTTNVDRVVLHNRTNCCTDRLSNVNVFVSEEPFGSATLAELKQSSDVWHQYFPGQLNTDTTVSVNAKGRYVRIQLDGDSDLKGILSLAEVQVFGGDSDAEYEEKKDILEWARGRDVKDEDGDGDTQENRYHMGDPLHSNPITVTYGGTADDPDSVVYVGTNEGYLHGINTRDGSEQFAFMPQELIENLETMYYDNSNDKVYGMDGALSLWADDLNLDGVINTNSNEHAYLYAGMRRGGSSYYALDVTEKEAPEFKWQINGGAGGTTGFEELGETWSKMVPATIQFGTTTKKVLIFGGGYDNSQDDKTTRSPDAIGRAIYIVDAEDGDLVWSGAAGDNNETKTFENMIYSMPATPQAIDANGDGTVEQIYIGDMGGRVWRFDIAPTATDVNISGGIIADFGTDGLMADARRFYHTPDISRSLVDGETVINIAIGSGYQAHPLNTAIEDHFYLIRYPYEFTGSDEYGLKEVTKVVSEDGEVATTTSFSPITIGDLYNATENLISDGDADEISVAHQQLAGAEGWWIKMEETGEKVLGSSVTFDNKVLFTSYRPGLSDDNCAPTAGSGKFWAVNLWDATPVEDFFEDEETDLTKPDRTKQLPGQGLPPPPKTLILQTKEEDSEEKTETQIVTFSGANRAMVHDVDDLIHRVYWSEYPNF